MCGDARSVLIHLLPGLALFAQRHFPPPEAASRIRWLSLPQYTGEHDGSATFWWCLVAPFIFYATWQTVYWFIVQVAMLCHFEPMASIALQSTMWLLPCLHCLAYAAYLCQQAQLCNPAISYKLTQRMWCRYAVSTISRSTGVKPAIAAWQSVLPRQTMSGTE